MKRKEWKYNEKKTETMKRNHQTAIKEWRLPKRTKENVEDKKEAL